MPILAKGEACLLGNGAIRMEAKRARTRAKAFDPAPRLTAVLLIGVLALAVLAAVRPAHAAASGCVDVFARR